MSETNQGLAFLAVLELFLILSLHTSSIPASANAECHTYSKLLQFKLNISKRAFGKLFPESKQTRTRSAQHVHWDRTGDGSSGRIRQQG
jgi:hypothetical protein